jgi:hypothetical protein
MSFVYEIWRTKRVVFVLWAYIRRALLSFVKLQTWLRIKEFLLQEKGVPNFKRTQH